MRNLHRIWFGLSVLSLICFGGCTHVVELSNAHVDPVADPAGGPSVTISKVTDLRKFEADPGNIQTPTLQDGDQIANPAFRSAAIGKAKNNFYTFYFVYPRGQSVETAVKGAVENALRAKGYAVVAANSRTAASAVPVEVEIRKAWLWWIPGAWTIESDYDVEVSVKSSIVLNGGTELATGHYNISSGYMAPAISEHCVGNGLDDLTKDLQAKLKSPR